MNGELVRASREGNIDLLYTVIQQTPLVLRLIDEEMFEDTPLHEAASAGHIRFAKEVMNLMPSFARKLNKQGLSPMHLALQNGHYKLLLFLLHANPHLVRVKGTKGITPLHCAAESGYSNLVAHFLLACPHCIEDVNVDGETVVHIAVRNNSLEVLQVVVGWLRRVCHKDAFVWNADIAMWRNEQGRTALEIAISNDQTEAVKLLTQGCSELQDTSLGRPVARYLRSKISFKERLAVSILRRRMNISDSVAGALLVVAGLMLAASFQFVYNPPGGFKQMIDDSHDMAINGTNSTSTTRGRQPSEAVTKVALRPIHFSVIVAYNSSILFVAICTIVFLLADVGYGQFLSYILVYLLLSCYISVIVIIPNKHTGIAFGVSLGFILVLLWWIMAVYSNGRSKLSQLLHYRSNNIIMCPEEERAVGDEIQGSRSAAIDNPSTSSSGRILV